MNPGFTSLLFILIISVLLACGWRSHLFSQLHSMWIIAMLAGWIVLDRVVLHIDKVSIHSGILLIIAVSLLFYGSGGSWWYKLFISAACGVAGIASALFRMRAVTVWPALAHYPNSGDFLWLTLLISGISDEVLVQMTLITFILLIDQLVLHKNTSVPFGGWAFEDRWWLLFLLLRAISLMKIGIKQMSSKAFAFFTARRKSP